MQNRNKPNNPTPQVEKEHYGMRSFATLAKNTTEDQVPKLCDKYKFVTYIPVITAFQLETHLIVEKDYIDGNMLYIPHDILKEDQKLYNGAPYMFFIFVTADKYVRKRVEKLFKKKLTWHVYEFDADDVVFNPDNDADTPRFHEHGIIEK